MNRYETFCAIDDRIGSQPGTFRRSDWWDNFFRRFYTHPTATRSIARVGRGGNKSTEGRRFAETELLSDWAIPAGERHYFAWVSENTDEAAQRPWQIEQDLKALGIPCTRSGNTVDLDDLPVGFKAFACRVGAVSGFRCIGFVCDEEAKWRYSDSSANPAQEVVASLRAMCVTHPDARELHISSPWGEDDFHAEQFALGNTEFQIVAEAASWVANPGAITEERTRILEPDEKVWSREYAAIPGATVSQALDRDDVIACFAGALCISDSGSPFCAIDSSKLRNDEFVCLLGYSSALAIQVDAIGAWNPSELRTVKLSDICRQIAGHCHERGIATVFGDDFESLGLTSEFERLHIRYVPYAWSETSKDAAFQTLRRLMRDRRLQIVEHETLRKEMLQCKAHLRPNGRTSYPTNGLDYLSALVTAMHAINDGKIHLADAFDWDAYREHRTQRLTERLSRQPWSFGKAALIERLEARGTYPSGVLSQSIEQRQSAGIHYRPEGVTRRGRFLGGY